MSEFTPESPFYLDSNGTEVHIGDAVSYEWRSASGEYVTRSGRVEQISFAGAGQVAVKVRGRSQKMLASDTTLIDVTTLDGILRRYAATIGGRIDERAIAEVSALVQLKDAEPEPEEPAGDDGE